MLAAAAAAAAARQMSMYPVAPRYQQLLIVTPQRHVTALHGRTHISRTTRPNFTKFSLRVACGCDSALRWRPCIRRYVLPVSWMTLCISVMDRTATWRNGSSVVGCNVVYVVTALLHEWAVSMPTINYQYSVHCRRRQLPPPPLCIIT